MDSDKMNLRDFVSALIREATGTNQVDQITLLLLVYLCDWHSCVKYNCHVVNVQWKVFRHGLADEGLESYLRSSKQEFEVDDINQVVRCLIPPPENIPEQVRNVINRVVSIYKEREHSGLATFVLSTYPILSSSAHSLESIDLLQKAHEYAEIRDSESSESSS